MVLVKYTFYSQQSIKNQTSDWSNKWFILYTGLPKNLESQKFWNFMIQAKKPKVREIKKKIGILNINHRKKTWKFRKFSHVQQKNFNWTQQNYHIDKNFVIINFFLIYFKLSLKIKVDPKMCTFENLEENLKTWKKFLKKNWQP